MTTEFVVQAPDASFSKLPDWRGLLARMSKSQQEKLRIASLIQSGAKKVLDAGCADGALTIALAEMFPNIEFLGIDLDERFIQIAQENSEHLKNVRFECIYLRQLLLRTERFDCVHFCSVLHEFWHYGEGISSVVKALADAHELLNVGGRINIRDMVLQEYTKYSDFEVEALRAKVVANCDAKQVKEFTDLFGELDCLYTINHFLLKYMYTENWVRECPENYVGTTFEQLQQIFSLLNMRLEYHRSYTLPFLEEKWTTDFGFTPDELALLKSTTFISAKKEPKTTRIVR